ncbi:carboxypeptidase-like regulatory domain-containing protein [Bizionia myxarmorum]|uniref:VWA domain-containing protein n=1 Tax=Bizionia myxarmorum TaxID=291186 RepID=A0A5D0R653_9FLAO|nr:carboxypeptidase-like regulatory domain-containing protein [Bizionia myxarmorum]TYB76395.1 VWA domain-containing protein [Bizionia myxarmorum]
MKNLLLFVFVAFISLQVNAQLQTISGTISDENGLPLPGVNVMIKDTLGGIQTNFDGFYSIQAKEGAVIVFAFIGYKTENRKVEKKSTSFSFSMQVDSEALEEVIVSALGIKRRDVADRSASSKVYNAEELTHYSNPSLDGGSSEKEAPNYEPQSGQLTAGEINDIEKWDAWLKALKSNDFKKIQENWKFSLENKVDVSVSNSKKQPLNNVSVSLYDENNSLIMKGRTDIYGKIVLFKDLEVNCQSAYYIVQTIQNDNVIGKKITSKMNAVSFILNNESSTTNNVDIMFTIDATGSMGDEIDYLKSELKNIISRLDKSIQQKRVALTFYRDRGDEYVVRNFDFTTDINAVQTFLANQNANGGGDYEEAVEEALKVSLAQAWETDSKAKIMFLLLDAPPHFTEAIVKTIKEQIKIAQEKGIKIIPIVASDANKNVEFLMRFFSVSTNGTYVFLTDDSGIGNSHMKPTTDDFKVEKLNDLIVRLIEKYSGVTS